MTVPPDNTGLLGRAMEAHRLGRHAEAEAGYARYLADYPEHGQALRLAGALARERGDLERSVALLERAVAARPRAAAPLNELALSLLAAGALADAERVLRRALECSPADVRANANLGALLQYRGHLHEAAERHRAVLDAAPDDLEVRCNLATTLVDGGRGGEALAECDAGLTRAPGHPRLLAARGAVLVALDRHAEAVAALEAAVERAPGDDMAWTNLAHAQQRAGDRRAAQHAAERAVAANPDNARAASDLANLRAAAGDAGGGIAVAEEFLARHPGERMVLAALALALRDAGRQAEADWLTDPDRLVHVVDLPVPDGFGGASEFRETLAAAILGDPSLLSEPVSKATRGGRQTGELDLERHPALAALGRQLDEEVARLAARWAGSGLADHPVMAYATGRRTLRAWGTVLAAGGRQAPHQHPLGFVSGVYYVRLPAGVGSERPDGWLEFGEPPDRWYRAVEPPRRLVAPVEGRLVLFPSWLFHGTRPFHGDSPRISIAFDALPVGDR